MGSQAIEIVVMCRDLPPEAFTGVRVAILVCPEGGAGFIEIGQTETVVGNINPNFSRTTSVLYYFERAQHLRFYIYNVDGTSERIVGTLASVDCSLGEVLSRGGSLDLPLFPQKGVFGPCLCLHTRASEITSQAVRMQFCARHLHPPSEQYPLNVYFMVLLCPEGARQQLLYKSEAIADKNPTWKSFLVPVSHFTSASTSSAVQMEFYNYNVNAEDKLIGRFTTSLDHLLRGVGAINTYKLSASDNRKKDHSSVELANVIQVASSSFVDYIKTGTQIHFSVAVDFTASNGNPLDPSSLHYIHPHRYNPYMTALSSVSAVIDKYNRHGRIAALGFGAQTPPDYQVSHLFFMNGDSRDPHVIGVDGVLSAYRSSLLAVRPYAPTDFSEVIYHVYTFSAAAHRLGGCQHYFVLLIVTDGCVTNPKRTMDAIVECSYLPMSIVIVGVGQRDFSRMEQLLSPLLKSSKGMPLQREIVTFVPYDSSMTESQLVAKLLLNVPRQFLTWATLNSRIPGHVESNS